MMNEYLMYGLVGGGVLLIAVLALKDSLYPYVPAGPLFTKAELNFYRYLVKAVAGRAIVFGKVRIADVIQPKPSIKGSKRTTALNKIAQKHFDYVLVHPDTMNILAAVELNDKSHDRKDRAARDKLVRDAMKSCEIPFIEVPAGKSYDLAKLFALLAPVMDCIEPIQEPIESVLKTGPQQKEVLSAQPAIPSHNTPNSSKCIEVTLQTEEQPIPVATTTALKQHEQPTTFADNDDPAIAVVSEDVPAIFTREAIAEMEKEEDVATCDMRVHRS